MKSYPFECFEHGSIGFVRVNADIRGQIKGEIHTLLHYVGCKPVRCQPVNGEICIVVEPLTVLYK
ncbi:MAG: hypothetical protein K2K08_08450 [Paramuribaculum sp.]|nr:hypothetical protein [Paramuribaculum sp.]